MTSAIIPRTQNVCTAQGHFNRFLIFAFVLLRYRKQMEEMQRAFNKTIIKLQNTSRIAEEQVS